MTNIKIDFDIEIASSVLVELSKGPDNMIATSLSDKIKEFSQSQHTPEEVWNFYKEILDLGVHTGGINGLVLSLLDLEPRYNPPEGDVFLQADGSINNAPWRNK